MRKVQLFRNAESKEWLRFDELSRGYYNGSETARPTAPKCPRYTVESCGEGLFHGFFQKTEVESHGPDHHPIALVEKPDGTMEEFLPEHVRFESERKTTGHLGADMVMRFLRGRKGFMDWWESIDEGTRAEIWAGLAEALNEKGQP